jgi:kynureninase
MVERDESVPHLLATGKLSRLSLMLVTDSVFTKIKSGLSKALPSGRLHFTAHSHHPWPNVTESAHHQYWQDSVENLDSKWDSILSKVIPESRGHLARLLGITDPNQLVEGGNTFELVFRVLSSFDLTQPLKILTTDSEFYSFERLVRRLSEFPNVSITRVKTSPQASFETRFGEAIEQVNPDLIFSSLVFFNSGFYADQLLETIEQAIEHLPAPVKTQNPRPSGPSVIIDLYHATGAVPLKLEKFSDRFFFVGGGYKYLSAGEGACFLCVPKNCELRPVMTGWFAEFGALGKGLGENVGYAKDGGRFAGATYDPSGWYRFNAVQNWWQEIGLTPEMIHQHARELQNYFISQFPLKPESYDSRKDWGNFLALPVEGAQALVEALREKDIFLDARDGFIRVGFGYYQSPADIDALIKALHQTASF